MGSGIGDVGVHVGRCQNEGPLWGILNNRCRIPKKGPVILATTHMS